MGKYSPPDVFLSALGIQSVVCSTLMIPVSLKACGLFDGESRCQFQFQFQFRAPYRVRSPKLGKPGLPTFPLCWEIASADLDAEGSVPGVERNEKKSQGPFGLIA